MSATIIKGKDWTSGELPLIVIPIVLWEAWRLKQISDKEMKALENGDVVKVCGRWVVMTQMSKLLATYPQA